MDWLARFEREMMAAERARSQGNEGRARVSARRAAGVVAQVALARLGLDTRQLTAFERLQLWQQQTDLPPRLHEVLTHMTMRVSAAYALPPDVDLLLEARWLADTVRDA